MNYQDIAVLVIGGALLLLAVIWYFLDEREEDKLDEIIYNSWQKEADEYTKHHKEHP